MNAIMKLELKKNLQDRGLIFWTIMLPIAFTVLFIAVFTSGASEEESKQVIVSMVPGYTIMFLFFIMIAMTESFIKDRNIGMVARMASTPLSSHSYLLGKWVSYMYIVMLQVIILLMFGKLVYDVPLEQPVFLLVIFIALTFTVTGLGLALALIVKTNNMGVALTQIIALGGAVLGGLWMPIDMMPNVIQTISVFLPQYWGHQAVQEAMIGTLHTGEFVRTIVILFSFGIVAFVIALACYPYFLKRAKG
ncbi:ABC transporter permease [Halalkalibacter hemicellulosilyticus]|uniref:Transport permease protein n=1 Tax=Halalkalibacter hemicellulosilyticusJCM 9152 TaxID=1236971 RepID=W4QAJ5_9BACI|nr:ABC transporter permease [Halalkalibacter hemicellulosilyticus]GAE28708.1 ABC-2 type transporter [Halalkalibacter hemicellulosilyticusJCM 9152]